MPMRKVYSIRLTATNAGGNDAEEKTEYVLVISKNKANTAFK